MRAGFSILALAAMAFVTSGCAANWDSIHREFDLTDHKSQLIDVKQRAIFVGVDPDHPDKRIVCPEPSPDALSVYAASAAASGQSSNVSVGMAAATAETGQAFGLRTQSIQLQRDAYTALCLAYLSGVEDPYEYRYMLRRFGNQVVALLAIEQLTQAIRPEVMNASANAPTLTNPGVPGTTWSNTTTQTTTTGTTPPPTPPATSSPGTQSSLLESPQREEKLLASGRGLIYADLRKVAEKAVLVPVAAGSPVCTLTADQASVIAGQPVTLNWTTSNATAFLIRPKIGTVAADQIAKGSKSDTPAATTDYIGTATGMGSSANCKVTVNVTPKETPKVGDNSGAPPKPATDLQSIAPAVQQIAEDVLREDYAAQMCFSYFQKYDDKKANPIQGSELAAYCKSVMDNNISAREATVANFKAKTEEQNTLTAAIKSKCVDPKTPTASEQQMCVALLNGTSSSQQHSGSEGLPVGVGYQITGRVPGINIQGLGLPR